jgi:hypothetical protein
MKTGPGARNASIVNQKNNRFYKMITVYVLLVRDDGMLTFGERVKKAWKNIDAIKQKDDDKNKQDK